MTRLLYSVGAGLAIGLLFAVPVFIKRWMKKEQLIQESKPVPRWVWSLGMVTFGGLVLMCLLANQPVFGSFFASVFILYCIGFIKQKMKSTGTEQNTSTPGGAD